MGVVNAMVDGQGDRFVALLLLAIVADVSSRLYQ